MTELSFKAPEYSPRSQALSEFLASLNPDQAFSSEDLLASAQALNTAVMPDNVAGVQVNSWAPPEVALTSLTSTAEAVRVDAVYTKPPVSTRSLSPPTGWAASYVLEAPKTPKFLNDVWSIDEYAPNSQPAVIPNTWAPPSPVKPKILPAPTGLTAPTLAKWAAPAIPQAGLAKRANWAAPTVANWAPPAVVTAPEASNLINLAQARTRVEHRSQPIRRLSLLAKTAAWVLGAGIIAPQFEKFIVLNQPSYADSQASNNASDLNPVAPTPDEFTSSTESVTTTTMQPVVVVTTPNTSTPEVTTTPTSLAETTTTLPAAVPESTAPVVEETVPSSVPTETAPLEVPSETAPPALTLYEQILADHTTLADKRGLPLGILRLDKFCDDSEVFVNNSIDFKNPEYWPLLSPEAQAIITELNTNPSLTREERRRKEDDVHQYGLVDAAGNRVGDPLYALNPDNTVEEGCVPAAPNPRASQWSYGSTEADQLEDEAIYWQPKVTISEYGSIPGKGGVIYISGHRSSQSAPFYGLEQYEMGETASYLIDGQIHSYSLVEVIEVDESKPLPDIINDIADPNGIERMGLQVCDRENPKIRVIYIFNKVQP